MILIQFHENCFNAFASYLLFKSWHWNVKQIHCSKRTRTPKLQNVFTNGLHYCLHTHSACTVKHVPEFKHNVGRQDTAHISQGTKKTTTTFKMSSNIIKVKWLQMQ